ncbi:GNAT family N-acetyltransferase [Winogradskya humida]|uniref:N-acetyltransferase domain-containing protein n=1 Tax=Winogradskya humida TaxID=113566 RepID=A0ABQ4A2B7_9ACTN|nr:GNAT family N-acetyltransferase [Actinoplanes humidus]GIE25004.1 hypothetical protein Ahu01nite_081060 [Actinoplanes humidus]
MQTFGSTTDAIRVRRIEEPDAGLADGIARVIAAAYDAGDLVPGLPVADGARETPGAVVASVAGGRLLWVAEVAGQVAGSVRAQVLPGGDWEVQRLAVDPGVRRGGIGRALLLALVTAAGDAGADRVVLDAVVERGNPSFYARVGFRTVRHFPAGDKLLSEVHMERDPRQPESAVADPDPGDVPPAGAVVQWWDADGGTCCRVTATLDTPDSLLGVDVLPGGDPEALYKVLAADADDDTDGLLRFDRPAGRVTAFAQPRLLDPALLAWWRSAKARSLR